MRKAFSLFAALLAAVALRAGVTTFANFGRDGVPVLIPEAQRYEARAGVFRLPEKLTVSVPAGEELIVEELADEMKRFGGTAAAGDGGFRVVDQALVNHIENCNERAY